ncbi:MAG TPA: CARDB domain-containing protein [Hyphomicrobiales bacterium]|nr:CARDB domain-containing protein [Hyphomicrobiales bacterium]
MFKHLRLATAAAALALSYGFTGAASADELPDLVISSVKLEATGKCNRFSPVVVGDLVIANASDVRAPLVITAPLFEVRDVEDPSFKDVDFRPLESLAPGETATARVRIGILKDKSELEGIRRFIVIADPEDRIEESNERNNSYFVRVRVDCAE